MARNINTVGEARKIEEEFRLSKSYTMHKHTDTKLITSEKLTEFFKDHLKKRTVDLQPEVITPHVLPPDNVTDIPTISGVNDTSERFKNGKCQGTDKIYGEEVRYNSFNRFMICLMILISTIWTSCILPSSWLISSITF